MAPNLSGKAILIVEGSLLAGAELADALGRCGARAHLTANVINAFSLLRRSRFDAAVIDHGLHNEAFDLCLELRDLGIPYISCKAPHKLQRAASLKRDADHAVWRLGDMIATRTALDGTGAIHLGGADVVHSQINASS